MALDATEPRVQARPLYEYATLATVFSAVFAGFALVARNRIPARIGFGDMARIGLASYKLGRLIAKDEVTAFVRAPVTTDEAASEPQPKGWSRALGELLTCPHCVGVWASACLTYALVVFPRETRLATTVFGSQALADFLNAGFVRLRET
jgi:hypothetical protein